MFNNLEDYDNSKGIESALTELAQRVCMDSIMTIDKGIEKAYSQASIDPNGVKRGLINLSVLGDCVLNIINYSNQACLDAYVGGLKSFLGKVGKDQKQKAISFIREDLARQAAILQTMVMVIQDCEKEVKRMDKWMKKGAPDDEKH